MAVIHYKSAQCTSTTVCGYPLTQLSVSYTERAKDVTCIKCRKHTDVIRARNTVTCRQTSRSSVTVTFEIEPDMASALAKFCNRQTFETVAQHAMGKDETHMMRGGLSRVRIALAAAGFDGGQ